MSLREDFLARLKQVDIVSFDVFDTAVIRRVERPVDVFQQLEAAAKGIEALRSTPSFPCGFTRNRIESEVSARQLAWESCRHPEVSFAEIYGQLEERLALDPETRGALMDLERSLELAHATRNPYIAELYDLCVEQGKRVGFVSDIYHDRDFIAKLLAKAGYSNYEFLVVSSERRATKAAGTLYTVLLQEWQIDPNRWLHIGDNKSSDVIQASNAGLHAIHYPKCIDRLEEDATLMFRLAARKPDPPSADPLPSSHLKGLIAAYRFTPPPSAAPPSASGFRSGSEQVNARFWHDWGYQHAGPLVLGFCSWILQQIQATGLNQIYFLSRDGYFIKQVFQRVVRQAGSSAGAIESHYLYASRRALNLAAIEKLTETDLDFLVSGTSCLSVADYLGRIDISTNEACQEIKNAGFNDAADLVTTGSHYQQLRQLFAALSPQILNKASEEFRLLEEYFSQEGISKHAHAAIVDLGWHGSLQLSLVRLLKRMGVDTQLTGYYLGTFPPAIKHIRQGLDLHAYLCNLGMPRENFLAIRQCVEIYEWIFSAPHGTVCGFERQGSRVVPRLEAQEIDHERWQTASLAQQGAMRFVEDYLACQLPGSVPVFTPELANRMLRGFLERPTYQEAVLFGNLRHAEGFGNVVSPRYIAKPPHSRWNPAGYLQLTRSYRTAFWRNGYLRRIGLLPVANLARATRRRLKQA
jgi:predicted HAD superfamily hydrolase